MKEIKIDIDDVRAAGSVSAAILAWADNSDEVASGVVGPSFSCSGPGSGWQRNHDETDYAARALGDDYGAVAYVDAYDGRVATLDEGGGVTWSDDSEVVLDVPDGSDALRHPEALAQMAAALDTHSHSSDCAAWRDLVESILAAAEKLEGIEVPSAE